MSVLDIAIMAMLLIGLWRGFHQGAVRTAMSLVAWLVGLVVPTRFADNVAPMMAGITQNHTLQLALGFLALFLVVIIVLQCVVYLCAKTLKALKLDVVDKLAGAVLGVALGALKILVVLSFVAPLLVRMQIWQESPLAQSLLPFAPMAKTLVMESVGSVWEEMNQP